MSPSFGYGYYTPNRLMFMCGDDTKMFLGVSPDIAFWGDGYRSIEFRIGDYAPVKFKTHYGDESAIVSGQNAVALLKQFANSSKKEFTVRITKWDGYREESTGTVPQNSVELRTFATNLCGVK